MDEPLKENYLISKTQLTTNVFGDLSYSLREFKKWKKKARKNYSKALIRDLKKIDRLDQRRRTKISSIQLKKRDSLVYLKIKNLVHENAGFPTFSAVGTDGYDIISTCLIHMNLPRIIEFLPDLQKIIQSGDAFIGNDIIYAIDRIAIESAQYLIYNDQNYSIFKDSTKFYGDMYYSSMGAFFAYDKTSKKRVLYPIHNKLKTSDINEFRNLFFCPSIFQNAYINKIEVNETMNFWKNANEKKIIINTLI